MGVAHRSPSLDTEAGGWPAGSRPTVATWGEMSDGSLEKTPSPPYCRPNSPKVRSEKVLTVVKKVSCPARKLRL